jgi:purine-cytosine permease-like protein
MMDKPVVSQVLAGQLILLGVFSAFMGFGFFREPILLIAGGCLFAVGILLLVRWFLARRRVKRGHGAR